jgi:hypothetical protein
MNIKNFLKKFSLLNRINIWLKGHFQEYKANKELFYYKREAIRKNLNIPEGNELVGRVRQQLALRGINPLPKTKGNLNIFLAFGLNNWESVLPLALFPFGQVTVFDWRTMGFDQSSRDWLDKRNTMNKEMLATFEKVNAEQPVDAVVGYLCGYNTSPEVLHKMAKMGAVIFNFCWDDKLHFTGSKKGDRYYGPAAIASAVDLNLTNAPDSRIKYIVEGGLAMFWPEAAHPDIHKPYNLPFKYDVTFVGKKYGWRPRFIDKLKKMGINVERFGEGWGNKILSGEEMVKLYSESRINLGFAGVSQSKRLMCLKGRDFEVPMSGGLYLTRDNSELALVYDVGKEIVTYHDEKDCAEKIKWLLNNPDEADKIRKAGKLRSLKDHTWEKRFEDIFQLSGIMA